MDIQPDPAPVPIQTEDEAPNQAPDVAPAAQGSSDEDTIMKDPVNIALPSSDPDAPGASENVNEEASPNPDNKEGLTKEEDQADTIPADATETVYLNNLNERVKIPVLKQTLKNLLKNFGPVLDVVAHRSVRMRGQAFVAFPEREMAAKAVKEVKGFPLYGKPIEISFARTPADVIVKRKTPDEYEAFKEDRLVKKKRSRRENPLRKKAFAQKEAARLAESALAAGGAVPASSATAPSVNSNRRIVQMPDEYQPPNKILFVQNLPENAGKDALEVLFKQYANLVEVRTIPGRSNIAFVEYTDSASSGVAKDALHNYKFDGEHKIKVTFAKQ
ncbi:hypothetical protein CROQUDRAFT_135068 [Cronartium quercuum f. sp. fusiforme G11]|uniref:RRM domain-containing protein n=1 Tax=Cronartium quercuum f. sp. fusiforme G11 TaxID=708437 RepID=A0A9P6NGR3_9BASI|nr:hypothetical protein CROQUDRAFT_135068 [Cronartium quercuum f. sp. fusiforme G11]